MSKVNLNLKENDISISHRLPSQNGSSLKPIIAKFASQTTRDLVYSKRHEFAELKFDFPDFPGMSRLYINENLTAKRKKLFIRAKTAMKACPDPFKYRWTKNGNILARKDGESIVQKVACYANIQKLTGHSPNEI